MRQAGTLLLPLSPTSFPFCVFLGFGSIQPGSVAMVTGKRVASPGPMPPLLGPVLAVPFPHREWDSSHGGDPHGSGASGPCYRFEHGLPGTVPWTIDVLESFRRATELSLSGKRQEKKGRSWKAGPGSASCRLSHAAFKKTRCLVPRLFLLCPHQWQDVGKRGPRRGVGS